MFNPITRYRKKPVVIEAIIFERGSLLECIGFTNGNLKAVLSGGDSMKAEIETLEGKHIVIEGDYIIKGVKGEFYPCKPDIFEMTYEKVN